MLTVDELKRYDRIYLLLENNKKLVRKFLNDKGDCCLMAKSKMIKSLELSGEKTISLETFFDGSFFEFRYRDAASKFLDRVYKIFYNDKKHPFKVKGVSILDANSGIIMLYYLRKACMYKDMSAFLLTNYSAKMFLFSSLKSPLAVAIHYECRRRKIKTKVISIYRIRIGRFKQKTINTLWMLGEIYKSITNFTLLKKANIYKFMFFCNGSKFHEAFIPVVTNLAKKVDDKIVILLRNDIPDKNKIIDDKITYHHFSSFRNTSYAAQLIYYSWKLSRRWSTNIKQSIMHFQDDKYLFSIMNSWFQDNVHRSIRSALIYNEIIKKSRPKIIIVNDPTDYEAKTLALAGKAKNILSFCIQFGSVFKSTDEWKYFNQDFLGVMGKQALEIMKGHGIHEEKIFIIGSPRFDSHRNSKVLAENTRKKLNIFEGDAVITYMSVPPNEGGIGTRDAGLTLNEYEMILDMLYDIPIHLPNITLIVKMHPEEYEYAHIHKKYFQSNPLTMKKLIFLQNISAYEILNVADIVITMQSATGLEAILLNKPLIMINITGREDIADYAESGAAYPVRSKEMLTVAIENILYNKDILKNMEKSRQTYQENNFSYINKSAMRTSNVILSLLDNRKFNCFDCTSSGSSGNRIRIGGDH